MAGAGRNQNGGFRQLDGLSGHSPPLVVVAATRLVSLGSRLCFPGASFERYPSNAGNSVASQSPKLGDSRMASF